MPGSVSRTTALPTSYDWPFDATSSRAAHSALSPVYIKRDREPVRSLLQPLIKSHHDVYHIEHHDQPNELFRVLVALHELGATREQIIQGYSKVIPTLVPLLHTDQKTFAINLDSWQDYLGNTRYYRSYLAFFAEQIDQLGMHTAIDRFFFDSMSPLSASLGSQLQPLVHMTFGAEYEMPDVVAQGLAYLASTHTDVSSIAQQPASSHQHGMQEPEHILFDMVAVDPRFGGRMEAADTVPAAIKILLKSQASLLTMYVDMASLQSPEQLVNLATDLLPSMQHCRSGERLLASALAIQAWASAGRNVDHLLRIQWLATLCTYIVENRPSPSPHSSSSHADHENTADLFLWQQLTNRVLTAGDPIHILTFRSLVKAATSFRDAQKYLATANVLVRNCHL